MDFQPVLDEIAAQIRPLLGKAGKVASYIPALARTTPTMVRNHGRIAGSTFAMNTVDNFYTCHFYRNRTFM